MLTLRRRLAASRRLAYLTPTSASSQTIRTIGTTAEKRLIATVMASMIAQKVLARGQESARVWAARLDCWLASGSWPTAERATEARKEADRLAVAAWNKRMLGFLGPAQPSPTLGDALNARYRYLEVKCLGCNTHQTVALDIVRRPKATPIHELERYMRCKDCSQVRDYPYKRSHLVALRVAKITASDPPSTWWPGER